MPLQMGADIGGGAAREGPVCRPRDLALLLPARSPVGARCTEGVEGCSAPSLAEPTELSWHQTGHTVLSSGPGGGGGPTRAHPHPSPSAASPRLHSPPLASCLQGCVAGAVQGPPPTLLSSDRPPQPTVRMGVMYLGAVDVPKEASTSA